jgi:hypothetical protein
MPMSEGGLCTVRSHKHPLEGGGGWGVGGLFLQTPSVSFFAARYSNPSQYETYQVQL